jgi:hypothetical protein
MPESKAKERSHDMTEAQREGKTHEKSLNMHEANKEAFKKV